MEDLQFIYNMVTEFFGFEFNNQSRKRKFVDARYTYAGLARNFTTYSMEEIGKQINRSHCMITHYLKNVDHLLKYDKTFQDNYFILENNFVNPRMKINPFDKYLTAEDKLQNRVISYIKDKYMGAFVIHVPNEGKRTPFERYKFKYLGGVSGVPDVMVFYPNSKFCGLALELKVGYNKPTENQERCLNRLKIAKWDAYWVNNLEDAKEKIDNYFRNA